MDFLDLSTNSEPTPNEKEIIPFFMQECKRFELLAMGWLQIRKKFDEVVKSAADVKYSAGGDTLQRGFFCPSPTFDLVTGGANRGRLVKSKSAKRSFEFYFDGEGQLIAVNHVSTNKEIILNQGTKSVGYVLFMDGELSGVSDAIT